MTLRLFGTFEAEKSDIDIVYGLVDQPQFWNPVKHQVYFKNTHNFTNAHYLGFLLWQSLGESHVHE